MDEDLSGAGPQPAEGEADRGRLRRVGRQGGVRSSVSSALSDAGAQQVRLRALKVPIDVTQLDAALKSQPAAAGLRGKANLEALGRALGQELVLGGDTPLWDSLTGTTSLVEHSLGGNKMSADGVVVVRTASPQRGGTTKFLLGLYEGLGSTGVPGGRRRADRRRRLGDRGLPPGGPLDRGRRGHAGRAARAAAPARRSPARASTASRTPRATARCRRCRPGPPLRVAEPLVVLIAARDEEARIGADGRGAAARVPRGRDRRRRRRLPRLDGRGRQARGRAGRPAAAPRQGPGADARRARGAAWARCCSATPTSRATSHRCSTGRPTSRSPRSPSGRAAGSESPSGQPEPSCVPSAASRRASRSRASARSRPAAREACFPLAPGLRLRGADDDRRRPRRTARRGARAAAPPPCDRPRRRRLRPPRRGSCSTPRSPVGRPRSTTAACACRSSAPWSHSAAARRPRASVPASPRSRCWASPTTSGAGRSAASARTWPRARPPAWRRRSGSRWSRWRRRARCARRPSSRSPPTR